jgi:hypothetical protein
MTENRELTEEVVCPWGWCEGDPFLHDLLCLHSKINYGISWAWTLTVAELLEQHGWDAWTRDDHGEIVGKKPNEN